MNCKEFVEFLMDYLEGGLDSSQRVTFEEHMVDCPGCVTYLDTYRDTIRLGRECLCDPPDGPVPDDVPEELVAAILAARGQGEPGAAGPGMLARLGECLRRMMRRQ
jgi:anti-sigma factor RsiW